MEGADASDRPKRLNESRHVQRRGPSRIQCASAFATTHSFRHHARLWLDVDTVNETKGSMENAGAGRPRFFDLGDEKRGGHTVCRGLLRIGAPRTRLVDCILGSSFLSTLSPWV